MTLSKLLLLLYHKAATGVEHDARQCGILDEVELVDRDTSRKLERFDIKRSILQSPGELQSHEDMQMMRTPRAGQSSIA